MYRSGLGINSNAVLDEARYIYSNAADEFYSVKNSFKGRDHKMISSGFINDLKFVHNSIIFQIRQISSVIDDADDTGDTESALEKIGAMYVRLRRLARTHERMYRSYVKSIKGG
jgi:hypothetical protein